MRTLICSRLSKLSRLAYYSFLLLVSLTALSQNLLADAQVRAAASNQNGGYSSGSGGSGTDVLNLVNAKRIPVSVLSSGNTSADNIQITNIQQDGFSSWVDNNRVVREAHRPYEEDAVEALLAQLLGHDYEE